MVRFTKSAGLFGAVLIILSATFLAPQVAQSATWSEVGDAGELLGSAQDTMGGGALTTISGTLATLSPDDIDLYRIAVTDSSSFSVSVFADLTGDDDVSLYLWDAAGSEILKDDFPFFNPGLGSFAGPSGIYYVGISLYATTPIYSGDPAALDSWNRNPAPAQTGDYTLTLTGAAASVVPIPSVAWLFGSALFALAGAARKKRK
jgi:hypothetical protein